MFLCFVLEWDMYRTNFNWLAAYVIRMFLALQFYLFLAFILSYSLKQVFWCTKAPCTLISSSSIKRNNHLANIYLFISFKIIEALYLWTYFRSTSLEFAANIVIVWLMKREDNELWIFFLKISMTWVTQLWEHQQWGGVNLGVKSHLDSFYISGDVNVIFASMRKM